MDKEFEINDGEPEDVDYSAGIPPPPNTIRDRTHLEELLLEGLNSGEPILADEAYWAEKRKRLVGGLPIRSGSVGTAPLCA